MAAIRLYIDEHVHAGLASVLRGRGYDAVSAHEFGHRGLSDPGIFQFAALDQRAVLTFNVRHFIPLANTALHRGEPFFGVILSEQLPFKEMHRRVVRLLNQRQQEEINNSIVWLSGYR